MDGLKNLDTSQVTDMSWMFEGCISLRSIGDISGWETGQVTNMSGMFYGCSILTSLDMRNATFTNNVTSYNGMFYLVPSTITVYVKDTEVSFIQARLNAANGGKVEAV